MSRTPRAIVARLNPKALYQLRLTLLMQRFLHAQMHVAVHENQQCMTFTSSIASTITIATRTTVYATLHLLYASIFQITVFSFDDYLSMH